MSRLIAVIVITLTLTACKERGETSSFDRTSGPPSAEAASMQLKAAESPAPSPRMIIRTANLAIVVSDTTKAVEKVTATAQGFGGYVSDSKIWREGELLRATISFRVPADQLAAALAAVRGAAVRIQSESMSSDEVTEEFVDLEARLRTLEATENELKVLMVAVRERARKASEVLEMHQQLMNIRSEIERTTGRMRYLRQMTSFATANVELIPDAIAKPVVEPGWQPVVVAKDAGRALVKALQALTEIAIWALIYFVPIVAMLFGAGLITKRAISYAWKTRKSPSL